MLNADVKIPEYLQCMDPYLREVSEDKLIYILPPHGLFPQPFPLNEIRRDFIISIGNTDPVSQRYDYSDAKKGLYELAEYPSRLITLTFKPD